LQFQRVAGTADANRGAQGIGLLETRMAAPPSGTGLKASPEIAAATGKRGPFRRYGIPLLLLGASVITTTANGARFMENFMEGMPPVVRDGDLWPWAWLAAHPEKYAGGFAFSGALLSILLIHEFGHYFACRAHKIRASLPWILPAPTLSGTMGAVIRISSRMPSLNAVMDVGIYGPLAGFVVSAFAVAVGFALSFHMPSEPTHALIRFGGEPLTIRILHHLLVQWDPTIPSFDNIAPHPVLVAGWIGLFITSLNLIPGGQLDGGHILYAISPRWNRRVTKLLPFALFVAGVLWWVGWLLWGLFMMLPALRHPKVTAEEPLSKSRVLLGVVGLIILLLTFTPVPFYDASLMHLMGIDPFKVTQ
jgi:membrane-associated protease RseP (regulator of RpoE activity)